jgi:hypothetical protein
MVPGARRVVSEGSRPGREFRNPTSLLIVRFTRRIVTVACATGSAGCFAGFPANSRVFHLLLPAGVATFLTTSPQSRIPPSTAPSQRVGPPASGVTHFRGVTGGDCDALEPSSRSHRTSTSRASGEPGASSTGFVLRRPWGRLLRLS